MNQFVIFWKDGNKEIIEGVDERDAFKNTGLSTEVIPAIDIITSIYNQDNYEFDGEMWRNKVILKKKEL